VAAAISLTALVLVIYADRGNLWQMIDLRVYLWAGQAARTSPDVYRLRYDGLLSFTYTPFALTICRAASFLSIAAARWVLTIATVAAMGLSAWLALGIAGQRRTTGRLGLALLLGAIVLWLEPVQQTLAFGQVNAVLMVVVLADLALPERCWLKGIGVGLAAGFKLTPAIFIGYLVLTRQWRAAVVAAATFAATVGYGFLAMPAAAHQYWLGGLFADTSRLGNVSYLANQSLYGALSRVLRLSGPGLWRVWLPVGLTVAVAGLTLATWAHRRQLRLLAVAATAVTGLLVSPVSWSHHWVWIAVVVVALADLALRYRSWLTFGLAVAVDALFFSYPLRPPGNPWVPMGIIWTAPYAPQDAWRTWHGLQWVTGDLYVLAGLVLLAALAGYLAVPDRAARPAVPRAVARQPQASPEPLPEGATGGRAHQ